jgi:hypothetical protein
MTQEPSQRSTPITDEIDSFIMSVEEEETQSASLRPHPASAHPMSLSALAFSSATPQESVNYAAELITAQVSRLQARFNAYQRRERIRSRKAVVSHAQALEWATQHAVISLHRSS